MKKIAFVMPWLLPMPPVRGGAVETLVDALLRENERDPRFEFTVFSLDDELARQEYPKYRHAEFVPIRVPKWQHTAAWFVKGVLAKAFHTGFPPGAAYLAAVMRALRGRSFDRVVVENQAPFAIPIARMNVGPVDLHMHNVAILSEQPRPDRVAEHCRRILCVSDYISDCCRSHLGNLPEKYRVLPNCTDVAMFSGAKRFRGEMRRQLGVGEEDMVFVYAGRLCPEKGALELAEAFRRLDLPEAKLMLVGSAWFDQNQTDEYQQKIREVIEPVRDRVLFTGYVKHDQMPKYYGLADAAVMPSIWDEPGSLALLEAQAAGLPVITTRSGGNGLNTCPQGAMLLERGEGLTERLAQSMRTLADDAGLRERMGRAATEWSADRDETAYFKCFCAMMEEP